MPTAELRGVFPYLVSPIDANGRVKKDVLKTLVEHLIEAGVHGLTPLGATGRIRLSRHRAAPRDRRLRGARGAWPGARGRRRRRDHDRGRGRAREECRVARADGVLAILEAYFPISEKGVEAYFTAIAEAVPCPIVLYTNPQFQRSDLTLAVIKRLSRVDNIRYIKDASTNTGRLLSILNETEGRMKVFAASAHIPACVMLIGGVGWMAGPACIIPRESVALYDLARSGKWEEAMGLQRKLWAVNEAFAKYALAACIKGALELQGFAVGDPLPPQAPLSPEGREELRIVLERVSGK